MVGEVRIYIEGGGDRRDDKRNLKRGFSVFFDQLRHQSRSGRLRCIPCGGRSQTHRAFKTAVNQHRDAFNILLVDSEGPVQAGTPSWKHLRDREEDKWDLCNKDGEHCHLMVQAMEAWFIADKSALATFYKKDFNEAALPKNPNVEEISKDDLNDCLSKATKNTKAREYRKTRDGPKILALLDPSKVRKAPHCEALFHVLEEQLGISGQ